MSNTIQIHKISVQVSTGGFNLLSVDDFLALSPFERTDLMIKKKITFFDEKGDPVSLTQGLKELVSIAAIRKKAQ
jgi:hypothetical protein